MLGGTVHNNQAVRCRYAIFTMVKHIHLLQEVRKVVEVSFPFLESYSCSARYIVTK